MSSANPLWGAPRIRSGLRLLGIDLARRTVAKYMVRDRKPPSQTWRTFLKNHVGDIAAIDFFTVPTVSFRVLFCFIVLRHERRRVVHFNVTAHPTAPWTAQQIVEAFPFDRAPLYLLRDRDSIYGQVFQQRIRSLGVDDAAVREQCPPVPPENSIRVAYRASGATTPAFYSLAFLATSPAQASPVQASPVEGTLSVDANE